MSRISLIQYVKKQNRRLIFPWMGTIGLRLTGYRLYDVYNSPKKQLEVAIAMDEKFQADFIYPMDDGLLFCEAMKLPLLKHNYDFPSVIDNPVKSREQLLRMVVPDPYHNKRMVTNLKSLKLLASHFTKPLGVILQGPFTLAVEMVGAMDICRSIIKQPSFIEEVLKFTYQTVNRYAQACVDAGVQLVSFSEPSGVILSPHVYEQLVCFNLKKLYHSLNAWKVLHVCGNTNHLLDKMLTTEVEGISLDQLMDLPTIAAKVPENIVLIGNVDPIEVLMLMKPEEVRETTLNLLRKMKSFSNYILSFGCTCAPDTPIDNICAFMEAGRTNNVDL
ncbi:uroporphyrinogen decarboxylase family protein [Candidatus Contubernalis alkaliaceticus]|uniref:uroporphyrinogen decarboxylase family protein n=1 Tax=Candidatus Contubernalis alkaliaceticus TaxID=338645 RepID=UPI001F4BFB03|nr:uroporphyrinogen decarboxylase family protein [Candidatus Contubernalis alkalaceticus]UNC90863.1 uroporphyrinogen decarboxylase family protein [Candidatus Contubernalis alkalaceticus]